MDDVNDDIEDDDQEETKPISEPNKHWALLS